jgi:predicted permease
VVAPLLLALLYLELVGASGPLARVTLFESAMGPMIGGAVVATQHGLDPPLVSLMVGVGTIAAFLSLPLWFYVLRFA